MSANERVKVNRANSPDERPAYVKVAAFAVAGLVVGIAWPWVTGIHIGPPLPGSQRATGSASAKASQTASSAPVPAATVVLSKPSAPVATVTNHQRVVVGEGRIERCYSARKRLNAEQCGRLNVSSVLVPPLKQLANCPSALGLRGEVRIGFELRFGKRKKELRVLNGKAKGLPSSTIRGIERCAADFMRDVSLERVVHKYRRYRVYYTLSFYPPGTEIETEPRDDADADPEAATARGLATVVWDSALIRSEPRVGKIVSRLVRGTYVKILGRRKDWYRVRVNGKDGWVYRGALGR